MRIDEKTRNVHFQWERDSSRSYSYTPSLIRTLYGKTYSKLTIETLDRGVKYV